MDAQWSYSIPPLPVDRDAPPTDYYGVLATIARRIAAGTLTSRVHMATELGLSRTTVANHIDTLIKVGLVERAGYLDSGGRGRPVQHLVLSRTAGVIAIAELGARHANLAIVTLQQEILGLEQHRINILDGPEPILAWTSDNLRRMARETAAGIPIAAVVMSLPARLDRTTHVPVRPGLMPNWDGFSVTQRLARDFSCPIVQENDVNIIALGEWSSLPAEQAPLVVVKVGTGIGAGMIDESGRIMEGFDGAAGEIGHIPVRSAPPTQCACGNIGCIEAVASVPAMITRTCERRPDAFESSPDELDCFAHLLKQADPSALEVVREAGHNIGEALAILCNTLNPRRIVLTGEITEVTDELLASVRSVIYQVARPLATRNLAIRQSQLGSLAGIAGGIVLGLRAVLSADQFRRH